MRSFGPSPRPATGDRFVQLLAEMPCYARAYSFTTPGRHFAWLGQVSRMFSFWWYSHPSRRVEHPVARHHFHGKLPLLWKDESAPRGYVFAMLLK